MVVFGCWGALRSLAVVDDDSSLKRSVIGFEVLLTLFFGGSLIGTADLDLGRIAIFSFVFDDVAGFTDDGMLCVDRWMSSSSSS